MLLIPKTCSPPTLLSLPPLLPTLPERKRPSLASPSHHPSHLGSLRRGMTHIHADNTQRQLWPLGKSRVAWRGQLRSLEEEKHATSRRSFVSSSHVATTAAGHPPRLLSLSRMPLSYPRMVTSIHLSFLGSNLSFFVWLLELSHFLAKSGASLGVSVASDFVTTCTVLAVPPHPIAAAWPPRKSCPDSWLPLMCPLVFLVPTSFFF